MANPSRVAERPIGEVARFAGQHDLVFATVYGFRFLLDDQLWRAKETDSFQAQDFLSAQADLNNRYSRALDARVESVKRQNLLLAVRPHRVEDREGRLLPIRYAIFAN